MLQGMQGADRFCRMSAAMTAKTHNRKSVGAALAGVAAAPDYFGGDSVGPGRGFVLDR